MGIVEMVAVAGISWEWLEFQGNGWNFKEWLEVWRSRISRNGWDFRELLEIWRSRISGDGWNFRMLVGQY
jgi:hypothetical protein